LADQPAPPESTTGPAGEVSPRVFISYFGADTETHVAWTLAFAKQLRDEGVDAWLDKYEPSPDGGWPRWLQVQLAVADFIVLICTPEYCKHYLAPAPSVVVARTHWEGALIRADMYSSPTRLGHYLPVVLDDAPASIPAPLSSFPAYRLPSEYEALYRRITRQPRYVPGAVVPPRRGGALDVRESLSEGAPESLLFRAWLGLAIRGLLGVAGRHRVAVGTVLTILIAAAVLFRVSWARVSREGLEVGPPTRIHRCLQEGRARDRAYVILSAVLLWRISDKPDGTARHLSLRASYVIRSLRDYGPGDKVFNEWSGYDNARFAHWWGPDPVDLNSNEGQNYYIRYAGLRGELQTVVTGAEYDYALPRPDARQGCKGKAAPPLAANEEALRYPNDQDVMCDLTILIESDTTPLSLSHDSLLVNGDRAEVLRPVAAPQNLAVAPEVRQRSLSLQVPRILVPGDDACLRYRW